MNSVRRRRSGRRAAGVAAVVAVCACPCAGWGGHGDSGQGRRRPPPPATAAAAASGDTVAVAPLRRALDRALRRGARAASPSAAQRAVAGGGRGVWSGTAGAARGPDAVFSLASITKPFIATLTLRRVEQGRL